MDAPDKPMKAIDVLRPVNILILAIAFFVSPPSSRAELLAEWNFNSVEPDGMATTGTTNVSAGAGTAFLIGGTTNIYSTGSPRDPATDDSDWNVRNFPAREVGNKTAGVQFNVSTLGYERILVTWEQRHSSTSSRHIRFQYSTNGVDFVNGSVFEATQQDVHIPRSVDLGVMSGVNNLVNNQANFAFRIVSEFQDTATGSGTASYVATGTGSTYGIGGTWRFDLVTITGEPFSGNLFPVISSISNQTVRMDSMSDEIAFTVSDAESTPETLNVTAASSDLVLLPNENIFLSGSGANQTVRILPGAGQSGTVTVTLTVTDELGNASSTSFNVTILPGNTAPTISAFTNYHAVVSAPLAPITFTVGDTESPAGSLTVTATSSNPTLIPDGNIVPGGSGADRTLTITPAPQQIGNAVINVTVSDGDLFTNRTFAVMIVPSSEVVLYEPFDYSDGSVNAVSGFRWSNHSGTAGQTQVTAGEVRLSGPQGEDISSIFIGAPYAPDSGKTLYSAFTVNFKVLPAIPGEYFAHFLAVNGSFRARVYATTIGAELEFYRLAIANNAGSVSNAVAFPLDLSREVEYLVVVRYDIASGGSTLWINPTSEADVSAMATDNPNVTSINAWAFRQSVANGDMGTLHVDDLTVGFSFADVLPGFRLTIARTASGLEISWPAAATDEGYVLESTPALNAPSWSTVTSVPVRNGGTDSVSVAFPTGMRFYRLVK
jgi:hypothetical protein